MSINQLIALYLERIKKNRVWILVGAFILGTLLAIYSLFVPTFYTSTSTIFPLSSSSKSSSSSVLSTLMGSSDVGSSFTNENSVNIIELAQSRTIRDEVARKRVKEDGNRMIAELMLDEYNKHRGLTEPKLNFKNDTSRIVNWAIGQLGTNLEASITKTNSFQFKYTGRSIALVKQISYAYVDEISQFYIALRIEKAKQDYEFATKKVDSLKDAIGQVDQKLINADDKTLFTDAMKLEYRMPTENMISDKQILRSLFTRAIANQQNAAYTLQRATPVIKLLDKPDPPYQKTETSKVKFFIIGFVLGVMLIMFIILIPLFRKFTKAELENFLNSAKE